MTCYITDAVTGRQTCRIGVLMMRRPLNDNGMTVVFIAIDGVLAIRG